MESREAVLGAPTPAAVASEQTQKFSLFALTMMVVGSMVAPASSRYRDPLPRQPARMAGNPAVDFFVGAERNWSNVSGAAHTQWRIGLVFKTGWRF